MEVLEESLLRKVLERFKELKFTVLFGSHRRRKYDEFSDLDVFVVYGDEKDKILINNELSRLGYKINQEIHTNIFTSDELENRLRRNDYLLASILEDSTFLFGDKDCFFEARQRILMSKPNENSIKFNRNMGTKILGYTNDLRLENYGGTSAYKKCESYRIRRELFLMGIKNYHLGLGYLLASIQMRKLNETISLRRLLTSEDNSLLKHLIWTEKRVRRKVKQQVM